MKKIVLKSLIITFIISAILGILIILLDLWDDVTSKILLTTITIFGFSIPGLACSTYYDKAENKLIPTIGMIVCLVSGIYFITLIWELFYYGSEEELFLTFILLSASFGHICLLLLVNSKEKIVNYFKSSTIALSIFMDILLLIIIFSGEELSWKLLIIISILIVLGTIVTPLLNKLNSKTNSSDNSIEDDKYKKIDQLKKLLDDKAITKKEYEEEKNKILNN